MAVALLGPGAGSAAATTFSVSYSEQTYTVPTGVTSVHVVADGARGGAAGGLGAAVSADLAVVPGEILHVEVPPGGDKNFDGTGGSGGTGSNDGGDASDVRTVCAGAVSVGCTASDAASLASRLIVAGGGGAAGDAGVSGGGNGAGGTAFTVSGANGGTGQAGTNGSDGATGTGGFAATGTAGGGGGSGYPNPGSGNGDGGTGGPGGGGDGGKFFPTGSPGGGGGGGYFGGGGGGGTDSSSNGGGGGGGSSFVSSQTSGATFALNLTLTPQVVITPGPADTTPPTITISGPSEQAHFSQGQVVHASYFCSDPDDAFAVSCLGTVPSGAAIDTKTPGAKAFTVNATDHAANLATTTVLYIVDAPTSLQCVVPKLKSKKLKAAKTALKKAHCSLGKVKPKGQTTGKVKKQTPKAGTVLSAGSKVKVKLV